MNTGPSPPSVQKPKPLTRTKTISQTGWFRRQQMVGTTSFFRWTHSTNPSRRTPTVQSNNVRWRQFLEAATWRAEPTEEEKETLWGAKKKLPLKPVEELSGSPVPACAQPEFARHRDSHRDLFLQSIQAAERTDQQSHAGRERRRNRLDRYPGMETVYSEFMREDAITGNRLSVKMISTQTTNPPERGLRSRRQTEAQPAVAAPPPPAPPPTHQVCPVSFSWLIIGLRDLLRECPLGRFPQVHAHA